MVHAGAEFWDQFFRDRLESGRDLDWAGVWTRPFLVPLREAGVRTILELGCGTGHDAARLAGEGYSVTAVDLSGEAIVAEESGQTMHFFSEAYLRDLLAGWQQVLLAPVAVRRGQTGEPVKHVWCGIARRAGPGC